MSTILKTGNYTITPYDNGLTIGLSGNTFYTVTVPDPATMPAEFTVTLTNMNNWTSGRAKYLAITGSANLSSCRLWPTQQIILTIHNGTWTSGGLPRCRLPAAVTFQVDPTSGSDTPSVTDGLATTTGAFASIQGALVSIYTELDFSGFKDGAGGITFNNLQTNVIIELAASETDTQQIRFFPHALVGAIDTAAIEIDLNGSTLNVSAGDTIQVGFGAALLFRNGTITCGFATGSAIRVLEHGAVYLLDTLTLGSGTGGSDITVERAGYCEIQNSYTIAAGSRASHMTALTGGTIRAKNTLTATLAGNVTFTAGMVNAAYGVVDLRDWTFAAAAHTVTGAAFNFGSGTDVNSILGAANLPGTTGLSGGITVGGYSNSAYNFLDQTTPTESWSIYANGGDAILSNVSFGQVFNVNYTTGAVVFNPPVTVPSLRVPPNTAPSTPASGWVIYSDSGDSNKLKAKASTGTVVTLGTP